MIDLTRFGPEALSTQPYDWALMDGLFDEHAAEELAATFPCDNYKTVSGYDAEKDYEYEARSLIAMGASVPSQSENLSPAWRQLAEDLLSPTYRAAVARVTGRDLDSLVMEVNVFHYGPGAWLGPHVDLKEKVVTHVFYFNDAWNYEDGGCLTILRSSNPNDMAANVAPTVGNSVLLMRSEKSWHAVSPVAKGCTRSRRSMTVTFYSPGSVSTLWPPGDTTPLSQYDGTARRRSAGSAARPWRLLRTKLGTWFRDAANSK